MFETKKEALQMGVLIGMLIGAGAVQFSGLGCPGYEEMCVVHSTDYGTTWVYLHDRIVSIAMIILGTMAFFIYDFLNKEDKNGLGKTGEKIRA